MPTISESALPLISERRTHTNPRVVWRSTHGSVGRCVSLMRVLYAYRGCQAWFANRRISSATARHGIVTSKPLRSPGSVLPARSQEAFTSHNVAALYTGAITPNSLKSLEESAGEHTRSLSWTNTGKAGKISGSLNPPKNLTWGVHLGRSPLTDFPNYWVCCKLLDDNVLVDVRAGLLDNPSECRVTP